MRSCSSRNCCWSCTMNESSAALVAVTTIRLESICAMYFSLMSCRRSMAIDSCSELFSMTPMWNTMKIIPTRITTDSASPISV